MDEELKTYWELRVTKRSQFGGDDIPVGDFVIVSHASGSPELRDFIVSLSEEGFSLHHGVPVRIDEIRDDLLASVEPCFTDDLIEVFRVRLADEG